MSKHTERAPLSDEGRAIQPGFTYNLRPNGFDEMVGADGFVREHWANLSSYLSASSSKALSGLTREAQRRLKEQGIQVTSYMTLAYGKALKDPVIGQIAQRHDATPAQVVLAWALQLGYAVIPSSTRRENLASNLLARALRLDAEDMAQIAALERNGREVSPEGLAPVWD